MPANSCSNHFRVDYWILSIYNQARFSDSLNTQLDMELLALRILFGRFEDPCNVVDVTELVSRVSPHSPLIAALIDCHVFCYQFFDALPYSEAVVCEQELHITAMVFLEVAFDEWPLKNSLSLVVLHEIVFTSNCHAEIQFILNLHLSIPEFV